MRYAKRAGIVRNCSSGPVGTVGPGELPGQTVSERAPSSKLQMSLDILANVCNKRARVQSHGNGPALTVLRYVCLYMCVNICMYYMQHIYIHEPDAFRVYLAWFFIL